MIDLARLTIRRGDTVRRVFDGQGSYEPFIVDRVEIDGDNLEQLVYSEFGPPVKASEVEIIEKDDSSNEGDKNKTVLDNILNAIYGDRWDIQAVENRARSMSLNDINSAYILLLHYPEITIRNSNNSEHFIRDLYVGVPLDVNYRIVGSSIFGTRTSYTNAEERSGYQHSHLNSSPGNKLTAFCTGGDILDEALIDARNTQPYKDPLKYEQFFELLNNFVEWESLEGGPFRRMEQITSLSGRERLIYTGYKEYCNTFLEFLYDKGYSIPMEIDFNLPEDRGYSNILNFNKSDFKQVIKDCLLNNLDEANNRGIPVKAFLALAEGLGYYQFRNIDEIRDIINNEVATEEEEYYIEERGNSHIVFRGNRVIKKEYIYKDKSSNELTVDKIVVPNTLIDMLINKLKFKFYDRFFEGENEFLEELKSSND